MLEFSWNGWLRAMGSSNKRKPRVARLPHIEGLETRALLTAPVAVDDSGYTVNEDTTLNGTTVLANDTDVDNDIVSAAQDTAPAHALSFTFNPDGSFTYTPEANFHGTDTFTYHAVDGTPSDSNIATVTITVNSVADLAAGDDSFTTPQDVALSDTVTGNDDTTSGGVLAYALDTQATHGVAAVNSDGTFTYTPNAGYNGLDSFTYTVTDVSATENLTRTVSIKVGNNVPVANDGTGSVDKNHVLNGNLTATDADQDLLVYSAGATGAAHGQLTINPNGSYTYTPNAGYVGQDTFSFKVNDGTANSADASIVIDVINHVPSATAASPTVAEDGQLVDLLTGTDQDNDSLTFAKATDPTHGTVTVDANGSYTYTPAANYNGPDSFTFTVSDGIDTSIAATVSITVTSVNDAPVANVGTGSTTKGVALQGTLTASDIDSDPLTFLPGVVTPAHGTVQINTDGTYTYTPTAGFDGQDMFSFKVNDTHTDSQDVLVTITVLNQAPTVINGTGTTAEDTVLTSSISNLGTDLDSDALTYTALTQPAHGVLTLSPDGNFTYTPAANYNGPDSFTFQANDGALNSNTGTFNITVTAVEDPLTLTLTNVPATVARNKALVVLDQTASVSDADTVVNYAGATVTANITAGGDKHDALDLANGALTVKGKRVLFDGTEIATVTGGKKGKALVVQFNDVATQEAVTAVLRQIGMKTVKKAVAGARTIGVQVNAGGEQATGSLTANVV